MLIAVAFTYVTQSTYIQKLETKQKKETRNAHYGSSFVTFFVFCFLFLKKWHFVYMYTARQLLINWPLWRGYFVG